MGSEVQKFILNSSPPGSISGQALDLIAISGKDRSCDEDRSMSPELRTVAELMASNGPRRANNADCPGEYRLAVRAAGSEVDPGKEVKVEIFITGYGEALGSKLAFYPPQDFIDQEFSTLSWGPKSKEDGVVFGAFESGLPAAGGASVEDVQIVLAGYNPPIGITLPPSSTSTLLKPPERVMSLVLSQPKRN